MIAMTGSQLQSQEEVLGAALRLIQSRINDRPPGPNDDAEADYSEDMLLSACRRHVENCANTEIPEDR